MAKLTNPDMELAKEILTVLEYMDKNPLVEIDRIYSDAIIKQELRRERLLDEIHSISASKIGILQQLRSDHLQEPPKYLDDIDYLRYCINNPPNCSDERNILISKIKYALESRERCLGVKITK